MRAVFGIATLSILLAGLASPIRGATPASPSPEAERARAEAAAALERIEQQIFAQETALVRRVEDRSPLVETYVQTLGPDSELGTVPTRDHYFLGKLDLADRKSTRSLLRGPSAGTRAKHFFGVIFSSHFSFLPEVFAEMLVVDPGAFDPEHYELEFVRREFLGEVRTLVFEVRPREEAGPGRFLGRIWVEDQGYHIARFNGTSTSSAFKKYLHFDSWRVRSGQDLWMPAYVYSEESDFAWGLGRRLKYKAQTRVWGYELGSRPGLDEFTKMMIEAPSAKDSSETPADLSPVGGLRGWERLAEDNVLERLTKGGLLATDGEVDRVLETVVSNLEVTNELNVTPEVRCRVLMTTPLESFTIGHTIVLSRGLIDVLPDEGSLAMVLAHELAHIVLGHRLDTRYAFSDRMSFDDTEAFQQLGFERDAQQEAEADARAVALLEKSPYKDKLAGAGLFLEQLQSRASQLTALIQPHLGDRLASERTLLRMAGVAAKAPPLEPGRTEQIAALPLGGRIKVDPWTGQLSLLKNKPVALLSAREKLPFEITPFLPYLTREEGAPAPAEASSSRPPATDAP